MNKMIVVSGKQLIKAMNKLGYDAVRQKGSHVTLKKVTVAGTHSITVPQHDEVAKGTLTDILNKVGIWNQISREELIQMLKDI